MKIFLISLYCLYSSFLISQVPFYDWAGKIGSDSTDYGNAITTDASGNVYTGGSCMRTVDFDIGAGIYTLAPASGNINEMDAYVSKRDASGNILWARRFGDTLTDPSGLYDYNSVISMAVDASGNVYALGYFTGTVDFDPGLPVYNLISSSTSTVIPSNFILKLDANGNFIWAKQLAGNYQGYGSSMAIDVSANIYITGFFRGTLDADPGSSVQNLASSDYACFIIKLNSSGNYIMSRQFSGIGSLPEVLGRSITVDASGNIYTTGTFVGTVDFDPGSGTTNLSSNNSVSVFILQLNTSGNLGWVKQIEAMESRGIAADAANLYVTGTFNGTVDFDPGIFTHNLVAVGANTNIINQINQFVLKLDLSGNYIWATNLASSDYSEGSSIAVDAASNVYAGGYFNGNADFDPGTGVYNINNQGDLDGFILKLDPMGNFVWAQTIASNAEDLVTAINVDGNANVYATGYFQQTCDFNPDPVIVSNFTSSGIKDAFVLKWGQCLHTAPPADVTLSQNKNICTTMNASLSATSANSIAWYASATATTFISTGTSYVTPTLTTGNYTYYIEDLTCGSARIAIIVSVSECTGIKELESELISLNLYPVPTPDGFLTLSLESLDKNMTVSIYNSLGELISDQSISSATTQLDLSAKSSGIYFVKISKNNSSLKTLKVIRQ